MCLVNDSYALHHRYAMYCDLESANRDAQSLKIFGPRPWKNISEFARYSAVPTDPCPRPILKSAFMKRLSVSCILSFGCCVRWFNNKILLLLPKKKLKILQHETLWKIYLYNCFCVMVSCDSVLWAVVKPVSKVNQYFFSAGERSFLDESHLDWCACPVSIPVEALLSVVLKCTWITFHRSQLGFDLDHKRRSFSNRVWRGVYCY